ncbi:MAG: DUF4386 domain-containing protein [Chloroflexi bacterium]|nr:DUF4386 domain-containing protein [Chloroflexota bacterium]OJV92863.1 MAG: hypothetical protein BGO39_30375 [Chloroflexi bacterium 54-19]
MITEKNAPRLLGIAFLFVFIVSLVSGMLFKAAAGTDANINDILNHISNNSGLLQTSVLFGVINSSGIVVLALLLYTVLNKQNKVLALFALGWWLAEAFIYAASTIAAFSLLPLSQDYVQAGIPQNSFYQTLGEFLYNGFYTFGSGTIHMWFYCIGGIAWYSLFYQSRYIPRVISLWGLIVVLVGLIGIVFEFFGFEVPIYVYLPIAPFEITLGLWLLIKGIKDKPETFQITKHLNVKLSN